MKVPIELRPTEMNQLEEFMPRVEAALSDKGLDDEAEEVSEATIINVAGNTYSAEATDWSAIIGGLRTLRDEEGLRSWWLRKKLAGRLSRKVSELDPDEGEEEGSNPTPQAEEAPSHTAAA